MAFMICVFVVTIYSSPFTGADSISTSTTVETYKHKCSILYTLKHPHFCWKIALMISIFPDFCGVTLFVSGVSLCPCWGFSIDDLVSSQVLHLRSDFDKSM